MIDQKNELRSIYRILLRSFDEEVGCELSNIKFSILLQVRIGGVMLTIYLRVCVTGTLEGLQPVNMHKRYGCFGVKLRFEAPLVIQAFIYTRQSFYYWKIIPPIFLSFSSTSATKHSIRSDDNKNENLGTSLDAIDHAGLYIVSVSRIQRLCCQPSEQTSSMQFSHLHLSLLVHISQEFDEDVASCIWKVSSSGECGHADSPSNLFEHNYNDNSPLLANGKRNPGCWNRMVGISSMDELSSIFRPLHPEYHHMHSPRSRSPTY